MIKTPVRGRNVNIRLHVFEVLKEVYVLKVLKVSAVYCDQNTCPNEEHRYKSTTHLSKQ